MSYEIITKVRGKQRDAIGWTAQRRVFQKGRGASNVRCHQQDVTYMKFGRYISD